MNRSSRAQQALPLAVVVLLVVLDLVTGRGHALIGLLVIAPLAAATTLGRRATVGYTLLALLSGGLMGIWNDLYTDAAVVPQAIRLCGIAGGGALAVTVCTLRLRRDAEVARLTAQAASTAAVLQSAEILQRNLLGDRPQLAPLESAARYAPASRHAQVGGDWYDAFPLPDGATMLVIGDVAGHDAPAAAAMAQTRGMLRALAQSRPGSPADVLGALDRVLANLRMHTLVTAAVATVTLRADPEQGTALLRWSNAGHPPPVLIRADGTAQLLERPPEPLLGIAPDVPRVDHELDLDPGDAVLFYTDGLVERRGAPLDDGLAWLVETVTRRGRDPLDRLCDGLLEEIGGRVDDDVALLAVRLPLVAVAPPSGPRREDGQLSASER